MRTLTAGGLNTSPPFPPPGMIVVLSTYELESKVCATALSNAHGSGLLEQFSTEFELVL